MKRRKQGGTYLLRDEKTGQVMRVGRTGDLQRRQKEHYRDPVTRPFIFEPDWPTNTYAVLRGREQMLHEMHRPPLDLIEPISPRNPRRKKYLDAALKFAQGV